MYERPWRLRVNVHGVVAVAAIAISVSAFWPAQESEEPRAAALIIAAIVYAVLVTVNSGNRERQERTASSLKRLQILAGAHLSFFTMLMLAVFAPQREDAMGVSLMVAFAVGMTLPFMLLRRDE